MKEKEAVKKSVYKPMKELAERTMFKIQVLWLSIQRMYWSIFPKQASFVISLFRFIEGLLTSDTCSHLFQALFYKAFSVQLNILNGQSESYTKRGRSQLIVRMTAQKWKLIIWPWQKCSNKIWRYLSVDLV